MSPPSYTVVSREERFTLSDSQIRFDSPNSFTGHFLGGIKGGHTSVLYTDRRPLCFPLIQEWLSGYDDFFDKPLGCLSVEETLRALLIEAEHFHLKKLAARTLKELKKASRVVEPMFWPYIPGGPRSGELFQPSPHVKSFRKLAMGAYNQAEALAAVRGNAVGQRIASWAFRDLQLRIDCRHLDSAGLPLVSALFIQRDDQDLLTMGGIPGDKPIAVEFWDSATQQASFDVDDKPTTLAVFLRYCASPTAGASKTPALQQLADYLRLDLTPASERIVVLRSKLAVGYWSNDKLRLFHVDVAIDDQGYRRCWQGVGTDAMAAEFPRPAVMTGLAYVVE